MAYRYYSPYRPITPGTFPSGKKVVKIHNFDDYTLVKENHYIVYGYIDFESPLTEQEVRDYKLVAAKQEISRTDLISRRYVIKELEEIIEQMDGENGKWYFNKFIEFLYAVPYVDENWNLR